MPEHGTVVMLSMVDACNLMDTGSQPRSNRARRDSARLISGATWRLLETARSLLPRLAADVQSDALSMREYDLIADWYWTDRDRAVGVAEALAVAATLPAGSCILDKGTGASMTGRRATRPRSR
jgi:hypothetical protein